MQNQFKNESAINKWAFVCLITAIFAGGIAIRFYGIDFGLPYLYDPDEPSFVTPAMTMLREKSFNPHWFQHPGSTTIYSLMVLYGIVYFVGKGLGFFPHPENFAELFRTDPSLVYLSGRLWMVTLSILCVVLIFVIARRISNRWPALLAAAIFAFSPVVVEHSQIIRSDMMLTLFLLVSFWFILNILERNLWKDYLFAGAALGLSVATKYPAAFFIPMLALTHFLARPFAWPQQWKLLSSALALVVGIFTGSPYLFIEYRLVIASVLVENRQQHLGATGVNFIHNLFWYVGKQMPKALSVVGTIFGLLGALSSLRLKSKNRLVLAACPFFYLACISFLQLRWERWMIPALAFVAILSAIAVFDFVEWIEKRHRSRVLSSFGMGLLAILILLPVIHKDLMNGREKSGSDTRTSGREWILKNIPYGSKLLMEVYTSQLPLKNYTYYVATDRRIHPLDISLYTHQDFRPIWGWSDTLGNVMNLREICNSSIDYILLSDLYDRYLLEGGKYPDVVSTYKEILEFGPIIQEFIPAAGVIPGPHLRVLQVTNCE